MYGVVLCLPIPLRGLGVPGSHPSVLLDVEVVFMLSGFPVGTV